MSREIPPEYKAFHELDEAVEKGKLVLDLTSDVPIDVHDLKEMQSGNRYIRTKVYDFDNGVTIVKEENTEKGSRTHRIVEYPEHVSHDYNHGWSVFYVFQDGNLVTEAPKVKEIVKQTTGVHLPKIDLNDADDRKGDNGTDYYRIVTTPKKGEWPDERFYYPDKQADEHALAIGADYLRNKIVKLSKETSISKNKLWPNVLSKELGISKKQLRPVLDKVRGIITEYCGIYNKKYSEKDKSMERIVEAIVKHRG
jgi:hypothetical protein